MRFQIATDYATRVIIYLARRGNQISPAREMAKQLGVTYSYILKVTTSLRAAGYIESIQGPFGGFRLAKDASEITLYDIIKVMEGEIQISRGLENAPYFNGSATDEQFYCPVHLIFETIQTELVFLLKSKRVSEFLRS